MLTSPYEYQVHGARKLHGFRGRALLADEMGLGKSLQYLLYLHRHPEMLPAVVVCPASLKYNWEDEAARHFGMRAEVLEGTRPPARQRIVGAPLYVVNYQILGQRNAKSAGPGWLDFLRGAGLKSVCLDECQAISNLQAKQTKWVRKLCRDVPSVVALSGTPLTNRPSELFSVLNLIRPDLFPAARPYLDRYCDPVVTPWGVKYTGAKHLDELYARLVECLMIRRRKSDVLKELPPQTRSVVRLPLSDPGQYRAAQNDFIRWLRKHAPHKVYRASKAQKLTQIGYLRRLTAKLKTPAVIDWVDNFLWSSDGKLVLFGCHTQTLDDLQARFGGVSVRVDGGTALHARHVAKESFQNNRRIRLFLGNLDAAGKGLTLTAASTVAFAELGWTPGGMTQAAARIDRIGQVSANRAIYLIGRDSYEEKLAKLLQDKQGVLSATLDGGSTPGDLDVFDLLCAELLL